MIWRLLVAGILSAVAFILWVAIQAPTAPATTETENDSGVPQDEINFESDL